MFTGIISSVGIVTDLEDGKILRARILCPYDYQTIVEGGSIAHDGICLTIINKVREKMGTSYEVEVSNETLSKTNIKNKEDRAQFCASRCVRRIGQQLLMDRVPLWLFDLDGGRMAGGR